MTGAGGGGGGGGGGAALLALLTLLTAWTSRAAALCPTACTCKWKGGKQTVECINKGLTTVPEGMDHGTQVLDLTGNSLAYISYEKFKEMNLTNLQRIYASRCQLEQLDDAAFRGLTNLVELDLTHNKLSMVPAASLEHVPGLMRLLLSHNPINKIRNGAFRHLKFLTSLEMTLCTIHTIEPRAFQGLNQLEWLKLDSNQLATLSHKTILPKSLHGVDLHNNPWHCDCRLRQLRTWLVKYNVPSSIEPKCVSPPRLESALIKDVPPTDFACEPEIRPTTFYLDAMEGKNVSFECFVTAEPSARIQWKFNGQALTNMSLFYDDSSSVSVCEESQIGDEQVSRLCIEWVTEANSGVFQCIAENQAGKALSNFTLRISTPTTESTPQDFVMDHIVYIGVALVALIVLVLILLCILVAKCCKRRGSRQEKVMGSPAVPGNVREKESFSPGTNNMPKYIQMGTPAPKMNGLSAESPPPISVIETSAYRDAMSPHRPNPDLISDAADDRSSGKTSGSGQSGKKRVCIKGVEEMDASGTRTTRKLDDILEEYEEGYDTVYDQMQGTHFDGHGPTCYASHPHSHEHECSPYPLTQLPPDEVPPPVAFYDNEGFPMDYGLPRGGGGGGVVGGGGSNSGNGGGTQWKNCGSPLSSSYNQLPIDSSGTTMYPTVQRRQRHGAPGAGPSRPNLLHDQKYPEDYHPHGPASDPSFSPPDSRYPQAYGLSPPEKFVGGSLIIPSGNGVCELCPPPGEYSAPDGSGRISGDGCSFENLLSSCRGGQCCYAEGATTGSAGGTCPAGRLYDNSLPENYRPLQTETIPHPPPPDPWADPEDSDDLKMSTWHETRPESPGTRVLYSPDDGYDEQQPPEGTEV